VTRLVASPATVATAAALTAKRALFYRQKL
jgi:hypothetical protein